MHNKKIIVVGGGPAGMMAAIRATEFSRYVTLVEKNHTLGRKLLLSGKGRCNLTNACELDSFLKRFSGRGEFLRDAFKKFFNTDLINFFETRGLKLQVERQLRVFPVSYKSASILKVLQDELIKKSVNIIYGCPVKGIIAQDNKIKGLLCSDGKIIDAEKVILATGGVSYPFTGSTGEGLEIARRLGHKILALRPGLVALDIKGNTPRLLEGLAFKNIQLKFSDGKRKIISDVGELLFTESGISGPLVLSLSGQIVDWLNEKNEVFVEIDLKPALTKEQLDKRFLREFSSSPRKNIKNILKGFLPTRFVDIFINATGISPDKIVSHISQAERTSLAGLLKAFKLDISKSKPIDEAMITRGGVSLKDIDPRTMESRIVKGLYFAGEIIDVDADTGGFNLQAAFSTGYLAGESAANSL